MLDKVCVILVELSGGRNYGAHGGLKCPGLAAKANATGGPPQGRVGPKEELDHFTMAGV